MANMKVIAKMAGVSLGTVSNVLNGSTRVREPLRKRVMDAVDSLGYQPSQLARGLRREKTNVIAMIIPDITNPFFPAVVRGAEDVAFSNGYRLILCNTDNDHSKELVHLRELRTFLPAGLIVIPSSFSDLTTQVEPYRRSGAAVVCVDRLPKHWDGDTVTANNEVGAFGAVSYLLRLGHTRLSAIVGPLHLTNSNQRLAGFKRAAQKHGIRIRPEYIQETVFDKQGGYHKATLLLRMIPRPTVIFAANDLIALGALLAVRDAGLRCPDDVSIIGYDNLDLSEMTNPPLTSVSQPGYQMGTTAASLLLDRVRGDAGPAKHVILETSLTLRHSVAPPPKDSTLPAPSGAKRRSRSLS
jgi:DNA-binding LacI/PurR family transcriptional regulator